jgi:RNA polymerase sigma-70 factor (ECF subfamily)
VAQVHNDIPDGDGAVRWLYGVARRVVSHQWRGAGRARRLAEKAGALPTLMAPGPDVVAASRDEHRLVRQAVMGLAEMDREVLLLSAWEGLTHAEIAEVVGCSHAAADKRVARAKTRLARQYESLGSSIPDVVEEPPMKRSPVRARKGGGDA